MTPGFVLVTLLGLAQPPPCTFESATPLPNASGEKGVWFSAAEAECLLWLVEQRLPALERGLADYRAVTDAYKALLSTQTEALRVNQELVKSTTDYAQGLREMQKPGFFDGAQVWGPIGFVVGLAATALIAYAVR